MNPTGIDYLTLYDTHPLDFIPIVAAAGAETLTIPAGNLPLTDGRSFSLLEDVALRRDIRTSLADHGVRLALVDAFVIMPGLDIGEYERGMEAVAELGVTMINTLSFDAMDRSVEAFGRLAEAAAPFGIEVLLECCPALTVATLAQAKAIAAQIDRPNFKLLIDTMHVSRSGEGADAASIDPALIGYVQVCDAPLAMPPSTDAYMEEAMYERMIPGEGELPIVEILRNVPDDIVVSAETPLRSLREAGRSKLECAQRVLDATRRVLMEARAGATV